MSPSVSSLLVRAQAHDQAAWERIVDVYSPLIYSWCRQRGLQGEDTADLGQEVFMAAARKLRDFQPGTFRGWLRTITQNKIADYWRRRKAEPAGKGGSDNQRGVQQIPAAESLDSEASCAEEVKMLCHSILKLLRCEFSNQDWQAFLLYAVDRQSAADVASALGITTNQVYLAKSRVLKRLHEEFGEEFPIRHE